MNNAVSLGELLKITPKRLLYDFHCHYLVLAVSKALTTLIAVSVDCSLSDETACYVDEFTGSANTVPAVEVK